MPKGIYPRTKEHNENVSKALKGIPKTIEHKKNMSLNHADFNNKKNPFFGKSHSQIQKQKWSLVRTGRKLSKEWKQNIKNGLIKLGKHPSYKDGRSLKSYYCKDCGEKIGWQTVFEGQGRCPSCAAIIRFKNPENHPMFDIHKFGALNPNWQDGKSFEEYGVEFNNELKSKVKKRDNYTCQECGGKENLHIHHKNRNKKDNNIDNLICLCNKCHGKKHKK